MPVTLSEAYNDGIGATRASMPFVSYSALSTRLRKRNAVPNGSQEDALGILIGRHAQCTVISPTTRKNKTETIFRQQYLQDISRI